MFLRTLNRRGVKLSLGIGLTALVVAGVVVALKKIDFERFRADPERMEKLSQASLLSIGGPPRTGEWPQWRGPNRDGLSTEVGLLREWPEGGPTKLWEVQIGRGFSSVAVSGGRVYTMIQEGPAWAGGENGPPPGIESVVCWDAATGREKWRFSYPNRFDERFGSGPRSTPAVDDGLVYAVGPTGTFHCLRADTGSVVWRHDLLQEFGAEQPRYGMAFSPLIEGDLVITTPGGPGGGVAAFHKKTGKLVWKALDEPMGYSSPVATSAAGARQVLVLTNTALVSLSPKDGSVYWRYPWEAPGGHNIATPIAFGDYVFLSSAYGKGCGLIEISAGEGGALGASSVYEHNRMRNYFASSVRYKDHLYGFDNSTLTCMEVRTGKVVWREGGHRGLKKGSLTIANGQLIVLGEYGRLALAEATPEGYVEKSWCQVSPNKCWTVPVLAGGRLYVRDEGRLVCLALRP
jgi:outer membrane protein assembly factor BamB